jgi:hypothetical protein
LKVERLVAPHCVLQCAAEQSAALIFGFVRRTRLEREARELARVEGIPLQS